MSVWNSAQQELLKAMLDYGVEDALRLAGIPEDSWGFFFNRVMSKFYIVSEMDPEDVAIIIVWQMYEIIKKYLLQEATEEDMDIIVDGKPYKWTRTPKERLNYLLHVIDTRVRGMVMQEKEKERPLYLYSIDEFEEVIPDWANKFYKPYDTTNAHNDDVKLVKSKHIKRAHKVEDPVKVSVHRFVSNASEILQVPISKHMIRRALYSYPDNIPGVIQYLLGFIDYDVVTKATNLRSLLKRNENAEENV